MRNLKMALLLFCLSGAASAAEGPFDSIDELKEVRSQIITMLGSPDMSKLETKELESTLHFLINKNSELVVLYVDTKHEFADKYLKYKLNYKKLKATQLRGRFSMKVTIKNGQV